MQETEKKSGKELIRLARLSIENFFEKSKEKEQEIKNISNKYKEKSGVFVTLKKNDELRGCIGFPYPSLPLGQAIVQAAQHAAFSDPRFMPLSEKEVSGITIEISILTEPLEIKCKKKELAKKIKIGRDGLIVSYRNMTGLLLPQVAPEQGWNAQQFLEQTCVKAGLPAEIWKQEEYKFYKFQAEVFSEKISKEE